MSVALLLLATLCTPCVVAQVFDDCGESSTPSYIVADVWFGANKLGNLRKPTKHAAMKPPTKDGPKRSQWRCGPTVGWFKPIFGG